MGNSSGAGGKNVQFELIELGMQPHGRVSAMSPGIEEPPGECIVQDFTAGWSQSPIRDGVGASRLEHFETDVTEFSNGGRTAVELERKDALRFGAAGIVVLDFGN